MVAINPICNHTHPQSPMNTIFVGGSRHISRLPPQAKERLSNIVRSNQHVIVGDANGVDKAVQKYLLESSYKRVVVFYSGERCRNNLGGWKTRSVAVPKNQRGFQFYAAKDREMALAADFGLMIWDGESPGTVLNVLRLIRAGKKSVLLDVPRQRSLTFKSQTDWDEFISGCSASLIEELRARATPEEWISSGAPKTDDALAAEINAALATGNPASVVDVLGNIARAHGMTQVAKEAGLARESLYRSLSHTGNPEFATIFKVITSMGLQLAVSKR